MDDTSSYYSDTSADTDTDIDIDTATAIDIDIDIDTDSDSDMDSESDIDTATAIDSDIDTDSKSDGLEWVSIAGGVFQMGSTASGKEQPIHQVDVPDFQMTRSEVTVAQYKACMTDGACGTPGDWSGNCYWNSAGYDDYPVNCVSWNNAMEYCRWVGVRLPSESEWEYAARSRGQDITYPWGNAAPTCNLAVMNDGDDGCGTGLPMAVCTKDGGNTAQGLCNMAGNLFEWVQDTWHANYNGAPTDGSAWEGSAYRFPRGGNYLSAASALRATFRGAYFGADYQNTFLGFRCARNAP